MTESLLTLVRERQAEATREVVERYRESRLPRPKRDRDRMASELSQLIHEHAARFAEDQETIRRLIQETLDQSPEQVDRLNAFLQRHLRMVISVSNALRGLAGKLMKAGYPVEGVESLDTMIAARERWSDDLPEQLALASRPVRSVFRERVTQALEAPPQDTDWRSLFK